MVSQVSRTQRSHDQLQLLKRRVARLWLASPERLWLLSIRLRERGHWVMAFWIKQLNTLLYHNSLAPEASVSPDIRLGHNSIGIVINGEVAIGRGVAIWQNTTLTAGRPARTNPDMAGSGDGHARPPSGPATVPGTRSRIVVEDNVRIGANSVIIAPRGRTLRIGRGARIGAGTVVTEDVPSRATVVGQPPRVLLKESPQKSSGGLAQAERAPGGRSPEPSRRAEEEP